MMRRLRLIVQLITRGAALLPLLAHGHGAEFLDARFELRNGVLHLRVVADHGDNPMIANEADARKVLADCLRVEVGTAKALHRLDELAPLQFTAHAKRDARSPMPRTDSDHGHSHHLLAASWRWAAPDGEVRFLVPESSKQTVLFWLHEPGTSPPRWSMLVPGDRTPAIDVKHPWWRKPWLWGAIFVTAILAVFAAAQFARRRHILR